jgi:uncharacterized damage-inducible protein DinB
MSESENRAVVEDILWRMDQAWSECRFNALVSNLEGLTWEEAAWRPMEGRRTILNILAHLGLCKVMYWEYAFGPASITWPEVAGLLPKEEDVEAWKAWLRAAHEQFRSGVAELTDDQLPEPRQANWGEELPTRTLINLMVEHDLYHGGEINYIRGLYRAHLAGRASP